MKIHSIFDKDPECGWDVHGNAYLWNLLRGFWLFQEVKSADEFEIRLRKNYREVVGVDLVDEGEGAYPEIRIGRSFSMSVTSSWWIDRLIPLLRERFEFLIGDCTDGRYRVAVIKEDISKRHEDVIVNPARVDLKPGSGGVSAAIHKAAGPELAKACGVFHNDENGERCAVGSLKVTVAGKLKCRQVYHVVPPNCQRGIDEGSRADLRSCYVNIFSQVHKDKVGSIAIPSIGTGKMGFPVDEAAKIAAELLARICHCDPNTKIVVCCGSNKDVEIYKNAIRTALVVK